MVEYENSTITIRHYDEHAELYIIIAYVCAPLAVGADFLSLFFGLFSSIIFFRLRNRSSFYVILTARTFNEFGGSLLEVWYYFFRHDYTSKFLDNLYLYLIYPLLYYAFDANIWFTVLIAIERWSTNRNRLWSYLKTLQTIALVYILSLAFDFVRFLEPKILWRYYHITYEIILTIIFDFLAPYALIIGFTILTCYRFLNKPYSRLTEEELLEKSRTRVGVILAVCFIFTNTAGWVVFLLYATNAIDFNYLHIIINELHTLIQSIAISLNAIFYLIFLKEYRQVFIDFILRILQRCGCKKFLGGRYETYQNSYDQLAREED